MRESTDAVDLGIMVAPRQGRRRAVHDLADGPPATGDHVTDRDDDLFDPTP